MYAYLLSPIHTHLFFFLLNRLEILGAWDISMQTICSAPDSAHYGVQ